jgi:excisionase family DNA binding protein
MKPNGSICTVTDTPAVVNIIDGSLLTVEEVAALLKVPPSWIYEHTRRRTKGRIPGFRLGKYWRFREADVVAWIDRQRAGEHTNA